MLVTIHSFIEKYAKIIMGCLVLLLFVFSSITIYLLYVKDETKETSTTKSMDTFQLETTKETATQLLYVDIKGAIHEPNVYQVNDGSRVKDIVELAGGFTEEADTKQVNLAELVTDEMVIYIPKKDDTLSEIAMKKQGSYSMDGKINLNKANKQELMQIKGVGEKKAEAILAFRKTNGKIKSFDDLKEIKGFTEKFIQSIQDKVSL